MNIDNIVLGVAFASNEDGTYSIPYKPVDVFNSLKTVIPRIPGFNLDEVSDLGLSLNVSVEMSWKSFGESIRISIQPSNTQGSTLNIKSKCRMGLVDWGKNRENLNNILTALQKELAKYEVVQAKPVENDAADQLLKLKTLLDNNAINKDEYETKKAELLKRI